MIRLIFSASLLSLLAIITAPQARADNIANCELVLMETLKGEGGQDTAQIASYRPAADFIASVYNDDIETINEIDGLNIRAVLCRRQNVIISNTDFKLLATGVPFILSQNFDSSDTDLLTYFFKDETFQYTHKGDGLSDDTVETLTERMAGFNRRETAVEALIAAREAKRAASDIEIPDEETSDEVIESEDISEPQDADAQELETQDAETPIPKTQVSDTAPSDTPDDIADKPSDDAADDN